MARPGRKRGSATGGETRMVIIEAAIASLAEQGFSATSARAVAERAEVAPGGLFYHFGSMDELLAEVFSVGLDRRVERLSAALDVPEIELPSAFPQAVRAEFANPESRALLELVVGAIDSPVLAARVRDGLDRSVAFTREVIDRMVGASPMAALLPLDLVAQVAASAFFGLAVMDLVGADVDVDGMADLTTALLQLTSGLGE